MKTLPRLVFLIFCFLFYSSEAVAQYSQVPQLRGAVIMAYSHIPKAFEGGKTVMIIPTWGFDIDYIFRSKWAICLQTDIKMQSFQVEDNENVILTRNYPLSFAAVAQYYPFEHWSVFLGPGIEYEETESLLIVKLGVEYRYEFSERFELGVEFMYENRQDLYDGWTFGVAFNTRFWKKKHAISIF